jgi:hypothetical protein
LDLKVSPSAPHAVMLISMTKSVVKSLCFILFEF